MVVISPQANAGQQHSASDVIGAARGIANQINSECFAAPAMAGWLTR
jgi:hypothetical protein